MIINNRVKSRASWLPADAKVLASWLDNLRKDVKKVRAVELLPVMKKFKQLIADDPVIRMYFTKMIDQVPGYYKENPGAGHNLKSIDEMLTLINKVLTRTPVYNDTGLVGFPINAILDWAMGVPAGFAVFRLDKINAMFREVLDTYKQFLGSPASIESLEQEPDQGGWMSADAREKLKMYQFVCEDKPPLWGFPSWNDFFIREFREGERPIDGEGDKKVIVSACESEVYDIQTNVQKQNWFWVKAQPYSLNDMLAKGPLETDEEHDQIVEQFVGGDVYQAFLSALKYHRWNSPVSGTIKKAFVKYGTYYSEAEAEGMDPAGPNDSQGYIAHTATRAIIYIEADEPVGLMCCMFIGMAEVSSCIIPEKIQPGFPIKKGEELGYFQFGGSTHCLIFRPGVIKEYNVKPGDSVEVNRKIAEAD